MVNTLHSPASIVEYENLLRPFALNLTQNRQETEDLLQDTFYRALTNRGKFDEGSNIKGWLFTIMRNTFINDYNRKRRKATVLDNSQNQLLVTNTRAVERNKCEDNLLGEAITDALGQINPDFAAPFMMHYNGYQYIEIANAFGLPLGTIKSRIFSARKDLHAKLKQMGISTKN